MIHTSMIMSIPDKYITTLENESSCSQPHARSEPHEPAYKILTCLMIHHAVRT